MIPHWLARWLGKPVETVAPDNLAVRFLLSDKPFVEFGVGAIEEYHKYNWPFRSQAASAQEHFTMDPEHLSPDLIAALKADYAPYVAASTLSRHGHAKRRASYREFHDAMAKAAGRPPIVWR